MVNPEQDRILEYTRRRFFSEGFSKISMDEIAADLGISKKTLYKYFINKDDLVEKTVFSFIEGILLKVTAIHDLEVSSLAKFCRLITVIGSTIQQLNKKFFQDLQVHTPSLWKKVDAFRTEKIKQNIAVFFKKGKAEGICENYPEDIVIQILGSIVSGVMNPEFLVSSSLSNQEAFRMLITIFINGILTEKGRKEFQKFEIGELLCEK